MNGRHSKLLPTNLEALYEEARKDPELLHLKSEAAILDVRLCELLKKVNGGDNGRLWIELQSTFQFMENARNRGDKRGLSQNLEKLGQLIRDGSSECATWNEINQIIQSKRKLAEAVEKRQAREDRTITVDQLLVLSSVVVEIFRIAVTNHLSPDDERAAGILNQTSTELQRLMPIDESMGR